MPAGAKAEPNKRAHWPVTPDQPLRRSPCNPGEGTTDLWGSHSSSSSAEAAGDSSGSSSHSEQIRINADYSKNKHEVYGQICPDYQIKQIKYSSIIMYWWRRWGCAIIDTTVETKAYICISLRTVSIERSHECSLPFVQYKFWPYLMCGYLKNTDWKQRLPQKLTGKMSVI